MKITDFFRVNDCSLREALQQMDQVGAGILCILDDSHQMKGLITDGDIRRVLLRGGDLTSRVEAVMNRDFIFWPGEKSKEDGILYLKSINRRHLPILDENRVLIDILLLDASKLITYQTPVVIMVGGLGSRLRPLTADCPKPLLKVGNKPLLERTIHHFMHLGFRNFYLSVSYLAEMIESYFGDGSKFKVSIKYIRESQPMGTAGSLSLLPFQPEETVLVMNGDIVTDLNFNNLLKFHNENNHYATMCVREMAFNLPYGIVATRENLVTQLQEKPSYTYLINAGIYALSPAAFQVIPKETKYDMPQLLEELLKRDQQVGAYSIQDYWLDIGHHDDYRKAVLECNDLFEF